MLESIYESQLERSAVKIARDKLDNLRKIKDISSNF